MSVNDDWQHEMHRLLEIFERESISSLRKISRHFVALGRPFDEKFRQYFVKKSTVRLDSSFDTVLFEQCVENPMEMAPNTSTPLHGNEIGNNTNNSRLAVDNFGSLNTSRDGVLSESKIENNPQDTIEIVDSDNEDGGNQHGTKASDDSNGGQMELNTLQEPNNDDDDDGKPNDEHNDTNTNSDIDVDDIKCEPKIENEVEIGEMDLPFVAFDPNKENERSSIGNEAIAVAESLINQNQASSSSSSSNAQKPVKRSNGNRYKCEDCAYTINHKGNFQKHQLIHKGTKPFKCDRCDYAARQKIHLITHQETHDRQKAMGVVQDLIDGHFKCTYCDQHFGEWRFLTKHLTVSHKNNQRLFNCKRCMRRFARKSEKERHELQCQTRRYECYLCKTYVTRDVAQIQRHMRTHSGVKPFQCALCNKYFGLKCSLNRHLDSIHKST